MRILIKLYVEEMNNLNASGTDKRSYQLQNIEKYRPTGRGSHNNASPISPALTGIDYTVADLAQYVNRKDLDYSPKYPSRIVNADGSPKIMYQGSQAQFDAFDLKKAKSSGIYGKGFYFTDSSSHAGTYGNLYAVYLSIQNPIQHGKGHVTKDQVRKFLEAVADNEDYSIENYGTYDVEQILRNVMNGKSKADAFRVIQDISITAIGDMVEAVNLFNEVNGTNYDGIVTATETVAFHPTQIKSATDNVGTFDVSNPNMYFSDRDPTAEATQAALEKENGRLRETETQQFKRWFREWQKHPGNSGKAVNADGTHIVVYHQSGNELSVHDSMPSGSGNSDNQLHAAFSWHPKNKLQNGATIDASGIASVHGNKDAFRFSGFINRARNWCLSRTLCRARS